jgi:hypothetical protein
MRYQEAIGRIGTCLLVVFQIHSADNRIVNDFWYAQIPFCIQELSHALFSFIISIVVFIIHKFRLVLGQLNSLGESLKDSASFILEPYFVESNSRIFQVARSSVFFCVRSGITPNAFRSSSNRSIVRLPSDSEALRSL